MAASCSSTPRREETDNRREHASPRQHCGVGKVGLGALTTSPSASQQSNPHFISSIPRLSFASWASRHVTLKGSGAQGHGQQGGVTRLWRKKSLGQGGEQMLQEPRLSGFLPIGPLPFPKHLWEPQQNDFDRSLSNSVFIPLARLLDVPVRQAGEINFRFKWENQD